MYTTILFDFDGTLAPSLPRYMAAFKATFAAFGRQIPDEKAFVKYWYLPLPEIIAASGAPSPEEFSRLLGHSYLQNFATLELFPGARELLQTCRAAGYATGLVTSSPRQALDFTLSKLGILNCFDTIISSSDITHAKPHPEPVLVALEKLHKTPAEALFVGDYLYDVQAGKAAGTGTCLFLPEEHRPYYDFDELRAGRPDIVINSLSELAALLQK